MIGLGPFQNKTAARLLALIAAAFLVSCGRSDDAPPPPAFGQTTYVAWAHSWVIQLETAP